MTTLWEVCYKCTFPYKVKKLKSFGNYQRFKTNGCVKCTFDWLCARYRTQFLIDLKNLINVKVGDTRKWVVSDKDTAIKRVQHTMNLAVKRLGIIEAESALLWAMTEYWHEVRTSWVHNLRPV